jgi:hypothetical protein
MNLLAAEQVMKRKAKQHQTPFSFLPFLYSSSSLHHNGKSECDIVIVTDDIQGMMIIKSSVFRLMLMQRNSLLLLLIHDVYSCF